MFTIVAVGIACLLAGVVLEAKFGGAIKSDFSALKAEVTKLIEEVRGAKSANNTNIVAAEDVAAALLKKV